MSAHMDSPVLAQILAFEPRLSNLITSLHSPRLIAGVKPEAAALWPDDRGWLQQLLRMGTGLISSFPAQSTRVAATVSYPGIAYDWATHHKHQIKVQENTL